MIELAIFDLDGTLLDTIEDIGDSVNEALRARSLPEHSYAEYCHYIGDGMERLIQRSLPVDLGKDPEVVGQVLADYRAAYGRNWNRKSKPFPGIVELLDRLLVGGVRLAVLSNKPQAFTELCVSSLLPGDRFERVYGQREGIPRKPDPGAALAIAEELGVGPESSMFIGDSNVDILTGSRAGMLSVGVLWGFRDEEELRAAGARHIVRHATEIAELVS